MASNGVHGASLPQTKRLSFGHHNLANASLMIEKQRATLRRSTPDSEALASSEDEQEVQQRGLSGSSGLPSRSARRSSWINDNHHSLQRKPSLGTSEPRSPGGLQHPVSSPELHNWSSAPISVSRNHSGSASLPWNSAIWNNDNQKGLPARLTEVLPSSAALGSPGAYTEEALHSPSRRDSSSEAAIPFAIPLQPTLKSYRSQSYSVGQLDQDPTNSAQVRSTQHAHNVRTRAGSSYSGLQHRPSRPSVLGEFAVDTSSLGQLREVDDDEESTTSSEANVRFSNTQARRIEQLAMENAMLRQRAQISQSIGVSSSAAPYSANPGLATRASMRGLQISESVLEEPDDDQLADDDLALQQNLAQHSATGRRPSEYAASFNGQLVNGQSPFVSGKKGQWQSSLGFGGSNESSQSRRHSFADVPVRLQASNGIDAGHIPLPDSLPPFPYNDANHFPMQADNASFSALGHGRLSETYRTLQGQASGQGTYLGHQQARIAQFGQPQLHLAQSLYLVTFKAARAEFYYVQEGTGLEVNPGDLVIVEADRGTDLGTVAHKNVDWANARELKEHYVAEHYNWLMMFSRQGQTNQTTTPHNWALGADSERPHHNTVGGMGPSSSLSSSDNVNAEIKPKMIKRLAQNHEIHTLREKEGNEAKAKRMCQQKVAEHHLNMEILDAEFQMDWKKLTFYYFADSYINFNSLVTDLFKIYKTRIWMSAINPASFVSPTAGPQLPTGISNTGVKPDRSRFNDPRAKAENYGIVAATTSDNAFDPAWHTQSQNSLTSPQQGPYSQYWSGIGFQQPSQLSQDYQPGGVSNLRSMPNFSSSYGPGPGPGPGPRPQSKSGYGGEQLKSPYADQLQALQGLALGPS